jgi:ADP-heptose:LPS heptosyltransferase
MSYSVPDQLRETKFNRILWVRTDSIGDAVLAASMLPLIHQRYQGAVITVLCQEHLSELYETCPHISNIICFQKSKLSDPLYRQKILSDIRHFAPDLILNSIYSREGRVEQLLQELEGIPAIGMVGNLDNISAQTRQSVDGFYTCLIPDQRKDGASELDHHRDFLSAIGIEAADLKPTMWLTPDDWARAESVFSKYSLEASKTIALFPGSQHDIKVFPRYIEALKGLGDYKILILGGEKDRRLCESIAANLHHPHINLASKTSLRELAAIIGKCRLYVGADTSAAHFACAMGIPNVVVVGGGGFLRFFPYAPLTSIVCLPLACLGCNWRCPYSYTHCIKDLPTEPLAEAIRQTLAGPSDIPRAFVPSSNAWQPHGYAPHSADIALFIPPKAAHVIVVPSKAVIASTTDFPAHGKNHRGKRLIARLEKIVGKALLFKYLWNLYKKLRTPYKPVYLLNLVRDDLFGLEGFSGREEWGAWTNNAEARIPFKEGLSGDFKIMIKIAHTYFPTIWNGFYCQMGEERSGLINGIKGKSLVLKFKNVRDAKVLLFRFKKPLSPKLVGESGDERLLGLGLRKVVVRRIRHNPVASWLKGFQRFDLRGYGCKPVAKVLSGFAPHEEWGAWTDGRLARIQLRYPVGGNCRLIVKLHGRFNESLSDGFYVGLGGVESRTLYSLKTKKIVLVFKDVRNACEILFHFANPKSPKELGYSEDAHKLGLAIRSVELRRCLLPPRRRYAAVFTDSRPQPELDSLARAHMKYLPRSWDCVIVSCAQNAYVRKSGVKLIEIPEETTSSLQKVQSYRSSARLWQSLMDYDRVLIFERDTRLLRRGVSEFLEWDYIGAPWRVGEPWAKGHVVGNGGLSLRNPAVMLKICRRYQHDGINDDLFFVSHMAEVGGLIAPVEVARKFSCETIFVLGTLGCHAIEKYLTEEQVQQILTQYKK